MPTDDAASAKEPQARPPILLAPSLPKGGGAIRGIGEAFSASSPTGTSSLRIPLAISPSRASFHPRLSVVYDSGSGNGPFGLGFRLDLPSIARKTDKGLPRYDDAHDSDVFVLDGVEDLVPSLIDDAGEWVPDVFERDGVRIERFRPRIETTFARIERRTVAVTGETHWRVFGRDGVIHIYGETADGRIADPADAQRVFRWLLQASYDPLGNVIVYEYKADDLAGVASADVFEHSRLRSQAISNRYLKRALYGNRTPRAGAPSVESLRANDWIFELVLDYDEHEESAPTPDETRAWRVRKDPFSTFRAGFEQRTYRLCRRVLMFHRMKALGTTPCLVRSTDFEYEETPSFTYLRAVTHAGYVRRDDGSYERAALPPLELDYTRLQLHDEVRHIDRARLPGIPIGVDEVTSTLVDLDGEGIAGVLTEQRDGWRYAENLGDARFAPPRLLMSRPASSSRTAGRKQLLDLAHEGHLALVELDRPMSGHYARTTDGKWRPFVPFRTIPNVDWSDSNLRLIDLDGDGFADVLVTEDEAFVWYPSLAKGGFDAPRVVRKTTDEEKGAALVFADGTESIYLADMSGDGLTDIVRIRNGEVCYWPNLGFGRFGAKVVMASAPVFDRPDQFDQRRIRLGDIDGTGTTDIVYLGRDGARIWLNQSGNSWSTPHRLGGLPALDPFGHVELADLLGSGTACLVWSTSAPRESTTPLRYVDLLASTKPHLLASIRNNFGRETRIGYAPSTKFYLEDKATGSPWATRLSFPVHVIERVEVFDGVQRTRLVTTYRYKHGYYDGAEREFRGFGRVDQWDAESYSSDRGKGLFPPGDDEAEGEHHLPPVHTIRWFHTGAWQDGRDPARPFASEYDSLDAGAARPTSLTLPGEMAIEQREAARALKGQLLRQEVYADDGTAAATHPYVTTENAIDVRLVQPRATSRHAVFFAHVRESIAHHYERNPTDPRLAQSLVLDVDEFGNALRTASIAYPRRASSMPEQRRLLASMIESRVANVATEMDWFRLGAPVETRTYEVTGLPAGSGVLSFDAVSSAAASAKEIPFEETPSALEKRLIGDTRQYYQRDDLSDVLPLGILQSRALPSRTETLALTKKLVETLYPSLVTEDMLKVEGGYSVRDGDAWIPSAQTVFDATRFFLPIRAIDPFANVASIEYDEDALLVVRVDSSDDSILNNTVHIENDARVLQPWRITDANGNRTAARFDALGRVVATAVMGKEGSSEGDTLDDPTTKIEYDVDAWRLRGTPASVRVLARDLHGSANHRWFETYVYSDGSGREAMTKQKVAADPTTGAARWVGTGRTVFDNKGNPVKKYEPFFSPTPEYEDETALVTSGVTPILRYDPLGRLTRTDLPNGTFSRVEVDAWQVTRWDANDTVKDSLWYADRRARAVDDPERRAADVTAPHAETPAMAHLDVLGRAFLVVADNGVDGEYSTTTRFDISGRALATLDAKGRQARSTTYDVSGRVLATDSIDAGARLVLLDVLGAPLRQWDARGHTIRTTYDRIRRPTHVFVQSTGSAEQLAERIVHGEHVTDGSTKNLRGRAYLHLDGAGSSTADTFDFAGNLTRSTRRLAKDPHVAPDWSLVASLIDAADVESAASALLEKGDGYAKTAELDAMNRVIRATTPDGSETQRAYDDGGLLQSVAVRIRGAAAATSFVDSIEYNARGQRSRIAYGNGTSTRYDYDSLTFRLARLRTTRAADSAVLQDLAYTIDPVGNIVAIADGALQTLFFSHPKGSADATYRYDAIYRLVEASGREHPGLVGMQPDDLDAPLSGIPHPNDLQALRGYVETYRYDEVGNIVEMKHKGDVGTGTSGWTRAYDYGDGKSNRLRATSAPGDPAGGPYSSTYDHDEHGNMTRMPHLPRMDWDFRDRMVRVDLGGGGTAYYAYDAGGQRVRKVVEKTAALGEETIDVGGYEVFRRTLGTSVELERQTLHVMDDARRIALVETATVEDGAPRARPTTLGRHQLSNHLSNALLEVDDAGGVISYEEYFPYGGTSFRSLAKGASAKRYRYAGKERDEETGLYYFGGRYYPPWLGRWAACDPAGQKYNANRYSFCEQNPIRWSDPDGRTPEDEVNPDATVNYAYGTSTPPPRSFTPAPAPPPAPKKPEKSSTGSYIALDDGPFRQLTGINTTEHDEDVRARLREGEARDSTETSPGDVLAATVGVFGPTAVYANRPQFYPHDEPGARSIESLNAPAATAVNASTRIVVSGGIVSATAIVPAAALGAEAITAGAAVQSAMRAATIDLALKYPRATALLTGLLSAVTGQPVGPSSAPTANAELGRKLEFFFGNATGSPKNVERSTAMLAQLESIGLRDTPEAREYLTEHLNAVLNNPSTITEIQENGRVVRESILMGPLGGLKVQTVWEGNKLITGFLFGGKN